MTDSNASYDDEYMIWVEAAQELLVSVGAPGPHSSEIVEDLADAVQELASMDPRRRDEFVEGANFSGYKLAALKEWIADSYDEDDIANWNEIDPMDEDNGN